MTRLHCLVVIPVYDHAQAIGRMVEGVLAHEMSCLLVDDGSHSACAHELDRLHAEYPSRVSLLRLPENGGKGAAMLAGIRRAAERGYSHVLQIDADGQHDTAEIPRFLAAAAGHPQAIICGTPVYDASVPRVRLYGRYLTHIWVWINTLSLDIRDSMCGFRVYPVAPLLALAASERIGRRMDFDTEVMVRLHWRGLQVVNLATPVTYPSDGVSHFNYWHDNLLISLMHTRLLFGMLRRSPGLLWRHLR